MTIREIIRQFFKSELGEDSHLFKLIDERMNSLKIVQQDNDSYVKRFREEKSASADVPTGYYDSYTMEVFIKKTDFMKNGQIDFNAIETVVHEIVHALSDNGDDKLGLQQYGDSTKNTKTIGKLFNEYATCYITSKILGRGKRRQLFRGLNSYV